jgi:hypothetical protein
VLLVRRPPPVIDATARLLELHAPPLAASVTIQVLPMQTGFGVMVIGVGVGLIVTTIELEHPPGRV